MLVQTFIPANTSANHVNAWRSSQCLPIMTVSSHNDCSPHILPMNITNGAGGKQQPWGSPTPSRNMFDDLNQTRVLLKMMKPSSRQDAVPSPRSQSWDSQAKVIVTDWIHNQPLTSFHPCPHGSCDETVVNDLSCFSHLLILFVLILTQCSPPIQFSSPSPRGSLYYLISLSPPLFIPSFQSNTSSLDQTVSQLFAQSTQSLLCTPLSALLVGQDCPVCIYLILCMWEKRQMGQAST